MSTSTTTKTLWLLAAAAAATSLSVVDARLDPKTTVTKQKRRANNNANNNRANNPNPNPNPNANLPNPNRQLSQRQLQQMADRRRESASQLPSAVRTSIRSLSELSDMLRDGPVDERGLFESHMYFPECIGLSVDQCEDLIEQEIAENPDLFPGGVVFDVRSKRQITDDTYNYVVLVTDDVGEHVVGRLNDGLVEYPFVWRKDGAEVEIGPWDCDMVTPLKTAECCAYIKASVPGVDDNGRELECYIQPKELPDDSKLVIVVDPETGKVVDSPHDLSGTQ